MIKPVENTGSNHKKEAVSKVIAPSRPCAGISIFSAHKGMPEQIRQESPYFFDF